MKLTAILLTAACLSAGAHGRSQGVSINMKNAPIQKVFKEVIKQTGVSIMYDVAIFKHAKPVTIQASNATVEDIIGRCLEGLPYTYSMEDGSIVITKKPASVDPPATENITNQPPPIDITGKVTDENGQPLVGATVAVKGTKIATTTDVNGVFSLKGVDGDGVIEVSFVGYESVVINVNNRTAIVTALKVKPESLNEVVINKGYYTEKQRYSVSNVGRVTAKDIEKQPINNPLLALQGRVPGVLITQNNGISGGGITVRIQGRNNLNQDLVGSDPLIIIDGVPYGSQNLSTFLGGSNTDPILGKSGDIRAGSFGNPLAFLNPSDIESIDVLKDADATAIYGSRAANGALIITTKKGKGGPMRLDITFQQGWGHVAKRIDLLSTPEYMEMRREAKQNDNARILSTDYDLRGLWDTLRYTDWQKVLIGGTAQYTKGTIGVSGGSSSIQYLINGTYGRETSVFPGDFENSFGALHFNISAASANQKLKIQLGGNYMSNKNTLPAEDFTSAALNTPPVAPTLKNDDGTLNWAPDPLQNNNSTWFNPLARQYNEFDTKTATLISNGSISYRVLNGLELKSTFGFTSTNSDQFTGALNGSFKPEQRAGRDRSAQFSFNKSLSWIIEPQIEYQRQINSGKLGFLVGTTFQNQENDGRGFTVSGIPSDQLIRNLNAGGTLYANGLDLAIYRYNAIFARINYNLKERYLFNITGRRDGSSRFGPRNRFSNFGAIGLGWIISDEPFFKKMISIASFIKLRGSFGTTGNDQLGNYRYMDLYQPGYAAVPYQGQPGLVPARLPNPSLEWEETTKLQGGLDLGFINDRILLSINYIRNRTSNNLTEIPLSLTTGFDQLIDNLDALIQNKSWEVALNTSNINKKSFQWTTNLNFTIPRNKLVSFPNLETSSLAYLLIVGRSLEVRKLNIFYGVNPSTGTFLVKDLNGNPVSNPIASNAAQRIIETGVRWYGGVQNTLSYKGVQIDFFVQFVKQYGLNLLQLNNAIGRLGTGGAITTGNQPVSVLERWQKPGDIRQYPRFSTGSTIAFMNQGDRGWEDISYARLKNVSVSYQLPKHLLKKAPIKQLRMFINGQNILTVTNYKGLDPETKSANSLPPLRVITIGLQAGF